MQPTPDDLAAVERVMRAASPFTTIGYQPCPTLDSGELWTVHIRQAGQLGIGQGETLEKAFKGVRASGRSARRIAA